MGITFFTTAEKRLALLLFLLTLLGLLARGGRALNPEIVAWLDEMADSSATAVPSPKDSSGRSVQGAPPGSLPRTLTGPPKETGDPSRSVDPNRATVDELTRLPGVGPVLARRILADRSEHGEYRVVEDLLRVSGIGKTTLERIRPLVRLSPPS